MKTNVNIMTASQIIDEFELVRMDKDCNERPVNKAISYISCSGILFEGCDEIMTPQTIADKINCKNWEVIVGSDGRYVLMMWNEEEDFV